MKKQESSKAGKGDLVDKELTKEEINARDAEKCKKKLWDLKHERIKFCRKRSKKRRRK